MALAKAHVGATAADLAADPVALRDAFLALAPSGTRLEDVRVVRAPGRVNVIGEHTDYNDGLVLPAAIDLQIAIAFVPIREPRVELLLATTGEGSVIDLAPGATRRGDWTDYVAGTAWALREAGGPVRGFSGLLAATLPPGLGLSSSAALELASAWALSDATAPMPDPLDVARACQRAENDFVGVPCGLMDQFAVVFGEPDAAVLLDCRSLDHRTVPVPAEAALLVVDSGVPRGLRASAYADRRAECARALAELARIDPSVRTLRDATPPLLEEARATLDDVTFRRARHVVSENERVLVTVRAFESGDLAAAGAALLASHASLRDDFEVSTPALDDLVALSAAIPGVFGARLTGAGFGGAAIVLAASDSAEAVADALRAGYRTPDGGAPWVTRVRPSRGAGPIDVPPG